MNNLEMKLGALVLALYLFYGTVLEVSAVLDCSKDGQIVNGLDDGTTCNTYHLCFIHPDMKKSWIIKTFKCPPGGIWDKKSQSCIEGTTCSGDDGKATSCPPTVTVPSTTPTATITTTTPADPTSVTSTCKAEPELECKDNTIQSSNTKWWKYSMATTTLFSIPSFHGYKASTPHEVLADGSVILQNPYSEYATKGYWYRWEECPKGMYAMGHKFFPAGIDRDHAGVFHLDYLCQTPGGNQKLQIVSHAKGIPAASSHVDYATVCKGTIVGFKLYMAPPKGGDKIAVDYSTVFCSTEGFRTNLDLRGTKSDNYWQEPKFCGKYQAMCGFQPQMEDIVRSGQDNTALNNLRIKCCPVEDPYKNCAPKEERLQIQECDNSNGGQTVRCDFETKTGLSLDYGNSEKELIFYSSVGYDFASIKDGMKSKIISTLATKKQMDFSWESKDADCQVGKAETVTQRSVCVKPGEIMQIHQVVGRCSYFLVRTNRFVKIIKDTNSGKETEDYFDV